ncbi:TATA box-binding protein-associated factor RNA polymerase I subunit B isoform X1 [Thunnus albacares]|uniref:TATA box-binding protein-associated factor RNA polymerase I subunit B isoform X1 n=1 Tax=Thunnus albacares TaxID=8236 RepID=UPI001CF6A86A|nr:TATA box-binding protein-associated factor RNA polymerase I subunit B isoform X1 [Thunnus albacares]
MDEEHTAGFREPCAQCSAVDWGVSDEGRFYCRSCHNVIERTKEVVDLTFTPGSTRVSTINKGSRHKKTERGRVWMICEGFQFILRNQADALLRLGVSPGFKDEVLCPLWRLYLQKSRQAYTNNPVRSSKFKLGGPDSESDSAPESSIMSASETDGETHPPSTAGSNAENSSEWSLCSGSVDATAYLSARLRRGRGLMTLRKTLALIHLALIWCREALTLSDLLRLVKEGHVPYVNAYEELPEEMKLEGKDSLIFRVESYPSHRAVHQEAQNLALFLQLPAFPPISRQSLLHPALLSVRYLTDANLPDELHLWVCRLMERAGMADQTLHAFEPSSHPVLPQYDMQAAALIIVTLKLLFGLDDHSEWILSSEASEQDEPGDMFNLRRWYRLLQAALLRAQQSRDQDAARKQWKAKKPLHLNKKNKWVVMKQKRIAEQVQICFEKLSSRPAGVQCVGPSSFRFCWGDEDGADGPSLHQKKLDAVLTLKHDVLTPSNSTYWHPPLRPCESRKCRSHYPEVEPTLPRTFVWLLQLFSFLLDVKPAYLYEEVLTVERRVLGSKTQQTENPWKRMTRTRTRTRTRTSPRIQRRERETEETR